jgi:hypothetical protein
VSLRGPQLRGKHLALSGGKGKGKGVNCQGSVQGLEAYHLSQSCAVKSSPGAFHSEQVHIPAGTTTWVEIL